jgi:twitching motility protein PilT
VIDGDDIFSLLVHAKAISSEDQRTYFMERSVDFSYELGGTRFRGSLIYQKGKPSCVLRKINADILTMEQLKLPPIIKNLIDTDWGMVLVTGPTGSGKSTTLASVVDFINERKPYHIATVEHPLEYIHKNKKSIITQREVGKDTPSFASSMKDILRQDPDVILVGEMRDHETISAAVTNAETGHLVLGTLHTNTAPHAINRIVSVYPVEQHFSVRNQLANNLRGVVNQRLVPKPGGGRTALYEIMVIDDEMRKIIREGRDEELYSVMRKNKHNGNILMEDSMKIAKQKGLMF